MTDASVPDRSGLAVALILTAMLLISVNDMVIKWLSGGYPLHQMVLVRSLIALPFTLVILQFEGGWRALRPARPGLQLLRALLIVMSNMLFFAALSVLPLATTTALFFVAPLFITLLSVPVLGASVGPRRMIAVLVGLAGVVVMMARPAEAEAPVWSMALPVLAAACYAGMQVLTRKLGARAPASAMAIYIQVTFILVGLLFWLVAGDGRFVGPDTPPALHFLLRPWRWPEPDDLWLFGLIGLFGAVIGYALSQAYRLGEASVLACYEYATLPLAVFWGWLIWREVPDARGAAGILLIVGAGLYVFLRERHRGTEPAARQIRRG